MFLPAPIFADVAREQELENSKEGEKRKGDTLAWSDVGGSPSSGGDLRGIRGVSF